MDNFDWRGFLEERRDQSNTRAVADRLGVTLAMVRSLLAGRRSFTWETKRRMAVEWEELWGPLLRELQEPILEGEGAGGADR